MKRGRYEHKSNIYSGVFLVVVEYVGCNGVGAGIFRGDQMKKICDFSGSAEMLLSLVQSNGFLNSLAGQTSPMQKACMVIMVEEDADCETKEPAHEELTLEEKEELGFLPKDMKITRVDSESDDELRWNERRIDVIGQNGDHYQDPYQRVFGVPPKDDHRDTCVDCQAEAEGYNGEND